MACFLGKPFFRFMRIKNILFLSLFSILLSLSFILPQSYFFWPESTKSICAGIACFMLCAASIKKKFVLDNIAFLLLITFTILCIFNYFINNNLKSYTYIAIAYLSIAIAALHATINLEKDKLITCVAISLIVSTAISVVAQNHQIHNYGFAADYITFYDISHGRAYANLGQPNILASLYVFTFFFLIAIYEIKKINPWTLIIFSVPLAYGIQITGSRTAYLSLIVGSFIIFPSKINSRLKIATSGLFFSIFSFHFIQEYLLNKSTRDILLNISNGRLEIWFATIPHIHKNIFNGFGVNETGQALYNDAAISFVNLFNTFVSQAHSLPLDLMLWFGIIPGIFLYFLFLLLIAKRINKSNYKKLSALIIMPFFIHAHLEYPLYYMNILGLFFIAIGIFEKKETPPSKIQPPYLISFSFLVLAFLLPSFLLAEALDLKSKLIDQKIYNARIHGAEMPILDREYMLDLPAIYIKNMGDFRNNPKSITIGNLEQINNYVTIPSYY